MAHKKKINIEVGSASTHGPFHTIDAIAEHGWPAVQAMAKDNIIVWSGYDKAQYFSVQMLSAYNVADLWKFKLPESVPVKTVHYGRLKICEYAADTVVVADSWTKELYLLNTLREAFECAAWICHYFPSDKMPLPPPGKEYADKEVPPLVALDTHVTADLRTKTWSDLPGIGVSAEHAINLHLADAITIMLGGPAPANVRDAISHAFPAALLAAVGLPLLWYSDGSGSICLSQSISAMATRFGAARSDALNMFLVSRKVAGYELVGGWGYELCIEASGLGLEALVAADVALTIGQTPQSALRLYLSSLEETATP